MKGDTVHVVVVYGEDRVTASVFENKADANSLEMALAKEDSELLIESHEEKIQ